MFVIMNLFAELFFLQYPLVPLLTGMSCSGTEVCLRCLDTYRAAGLKADVANEGHSSELCSLSPVSLYLAVHKQPFVVACCTHGWAQEEAPKADLRGLCSAQMQSSFNGSGQSCLLAGSALLCRCWQMHLAALGRELELLSLSSLLF